MGSSTKSNDAKTKGKTIGQNIVGSVQSLKHEQAARVLFTT
jgi:hypothetical protein